MAQKKTNNASKKLEATNKKVATQKVIINRVLKYKYPKGCTDTLLRKAFRQRVRGKIQKLEAKISKLRGEPRKTLKETLAKYEATVLS